MSKIAPRKVRECLQPTYIEGSKGPIFCLRASCESSGNPVSGNTSGVAKRVKLACQISDDVGSHLVLFVPPFGEEINLCRRFFSLVRSRLSQAGLVSVQPDLYGTGDSAGSLDEADWALWQDDLKRVLDHFCNTDSDDCKVERISLVAVRAGCLLAKSLIQFIDQDVEFASLKNVVFVQPESDGQAIVNRLFRARVMAQRLAGDKSQSTQDLWSLIDREQLIHASGHSLSSQLCQSMRTQHLDDVLTMPPGTSNTWFNLQPTSVVRDSGHVQLSGWKICDMPSSAFWQAYEVEPEPALIAAIVNATVP